MAPKKEPTTPGKEAQGVTWVASTGVVWTDSGTVTVEKLKKWAEGPYGDEVTQNLRDLIFVGPPTVRALHRQTGEADPELSAWLAAMADAVQLAAKIQLAWVSTFWYGPSLQSPAIERVENEWRLTELRYLPPDSFSRRPSEPQIKAACALLPGIILTTDDEVQYWQVQDITDTTPRRVENVLEVRDPCRPELGSTPTVKAITSAFAMLEYLWHAQMQKGHRVGAPLLFIQIIGARTSAQLGGKMGDVEYAQQFHRNWGKNTGWTLRENMTLVDPHITDLADNLETIEALTTLVDRHFSPTDWIAKDQATIGGSAGPELQLLCSKFRGIQAWLEAPYSALFQEVLDANGLVDYRAEVELPDLEFDQRDLDMQVAEASYRTMDTTRNERRKLYGLPPLDEEQEAALEAEFSRQAPETIPPIAFGNVAAAVTAPMAATAEDEIARAVDAARDRVLQALEGL